MNTRQYEMNTDKPPGNGNGNGNGHEEIPRKKNLLTALEPPNPLRAFTDPGDSPLKLLMRTILADENEARLMAIALSHNTEFDCDEDNDSLLTYMAAKVSVEGTSRKELLMAQSQIVAPALYGKKGEPTQREQKKNNNNQNGNMNNTTT